MTARLTGPIHAIQWLQPLHCRRWPKKPEGLFRVAPRRLTSADFSARLIQRLLEVAYSAVDIAEFVETKQPDAEGAVVRWFVALQWHASGGLPPVASSSSVVTV